MKHFTDRLKPFFFIFIALAFIAGSASALTITSTPDYMVNPLSTWEYNITFTNVVDWRGNLTFSTSIPKLVIYDWNMSYIPTSEDVGVYYVNITLHDTIATVETYDYQNFTLAVEPMATIGNEYLVLGLVFGFGVIAMGIFDRRWMFLAGIIWVYISLAVFGIFGVPWMIIGLGFGFVLMMDGAMHLGQGG